MKMGIIADDYTGATDAASFVVKGGLRTLQINRIPNTPLSEEYDAVVIGLKTRSCSTQEAIKQSIDACRWLKRQGCERIYFKYCSTFDSTEQGNIGPVTDALMHEIGTSHTLICPALPVNGRTVYQGYLFVHDALLNESGMKNHPLTPMHDANLLRLMDAQSEGQSALISYEDIISREHLLDEIKKHVAQGKRYLVCDSLNSSHVDMWGEVAALMPLSTGGSGLAGGIAKALCDENHSESQTFVPSRHQKGVVISGSCSLMTNEQVKEYKNHAPSKFIEVEKCLTNSGYANKIKDWVLRHSNGPNYPMLYATVDANTLKSIQDEWGSQASEAVERLFYEVVRLLKNEGYKVFISAGGETSGTVTQALNVEEFEIGKEIAPGVPWVTSHQDNVSLALKSGNFGNPDFFIHAQEMMR
ncbi:conserved hypothetical protein [Vibrio nigripulchritudo SO65]|uniref:3-oxo-tetronate kinase n=1 Tax=Vibrio nigripulchritudo TaxID=28173 RepID=UPI0003B21900|nr:3-oxo-tetronate kinase [Vibrio nigripulchritudo]CCN33611.1 conserved hypothetical protein [Vibrio nigripulchritudo AM115]CCN44738.1 conserved hypothetical protein [Vibrio nigripulchritudo FTn2]CCN62991.1 conserved hypothetical protein [Vibrio nigripulchritudo POn4]CCN75133.1 conserved hypothetical protein [Vibrio nigripulchritudo SO65]